MEMRSLSHLSVGRGRRSEVAVIAAAAVTSGTLSEKFLRVFVDPHRRGWGMLDSTSIPAEGTMHLRRWFGRGVLGVERLVCLGRRVFVQRMFLDAQQPLEPGHDEERKVASEPTVGIISRHLVVAIDDTSWGHALFDSSMIMGVGDSSNSCAKGVSR